MKNFKFILLTLSLNLVIILFIYQGAFSLEFQGDGWQYGWHHQIYYGSNVFSAESLKGIRSSLAGASLTFGLIENNFGLNAKVFYTISVILKFLTVVVFFFLIRKITGNNLASLVASLLLSATFAGVEATHWVFNMYAYIGLIFIMLSILVGLDLPNNFKFKKWLISFLFACVGVWYATMRTNGIIPLIIIWGFYKFITLRSKSSKVNLISWIVGFAIFITADKFLLGQMETDYSKTYIIGEGLRAFQNQIALGKYDFLLSPASNVGVVILPDVTWSFLNFPKLFSFFGSGIFPSVILPSFFSFIIFSWILSSAIKSKKILIFSLGLCWTGFTYFILKLGPLNFSSWVNLAATLFGGYFMIWCFFLFIQKGVKTYLRDFFLITFLWSFLYLLLPLFQNGGPTYGIQYRYLVTTAPAVPMFMAGLVTLISIYKNNLLKNLTLIIIFLMFFSHASQTKAFFDRKAMVHNRQLSTKLWKQFKGIVPDKEEYAQKNPPTLWFEAADNAIDQDTLFETLYFGFIFQAGIKYNWSPQNGVGLYNRDNYQDLIKEVKKNPKKLDNFYAVRVENQSLSDITQTMRQKIAEDVEKIL